MRRTLLKTVSMKARDWIIVVALASVMAPFTYFAGARAWGWDSQWGLPYLVANVVVPIVVGAIIYAIRARK